MGGNIGGVVGRRGVKFGAGGEGGSEEYKGEKRGKNRSFCGEN